MVGRWAARVLGVTLAGGLTVAARADTAGPPAPTPAPLAMPAGTRSVDRPADSPADGPADRRPGRQLVVFTGADADGFSMFGGGGLKWRPQAGGWASPLTLLVSQGQGWWHNRTGLAAGRQEDVLTARLSVLAGRDFAFGPGTLGVYAGIEFVRDITVRSWLRRFADVQRTGARLQFDWWQKSETALFTMVAVAGSAKRDLWARASYGWALGSYGFAGPEIGLSLSRNDVIIRGGLHWAELPFGRLRLRVAAGVAQQRGKTGAYVAVSQYRPF